MTERDPFEHDDAAYVLGALSPAETVAFETHLKTCPDCAARVREIQGVPDLLAGLTMTDLTEPAALDRPPDTLLPGLLRRAAGRRRRERGLIAGLAGVAAACLIALVVVAWPTSSSSPSKHPAALSFTQLAASPVRATATLTAEAWGTGIDLHCHYVAHSVKRGYGYTMVVYGTHNRRETVGSWKLPPDRDVDFPAGTSLSRAQITRIDITLPDGTPVLRLTT